VHYAQIHSRRWDDGVEETGLYSSTVECRVEDGSMSLNLALPQQLLREILCDGNTSSHGPWALAMYVTAHSLLHSLNRSCSICFMASPGKHRKQFNHTVILMITSVIQSYRGGRNRRRIQWISQALNEIPKHSNRSSRGCRAIWNAHTSQGNGSRGISTGHTSSVKECINSSGECICWWEGI
jgi:hypothetical protein